MERCSLSLGKCKLNPVWAVTTHLLALARSRKTEHAKCAEHWHKGRVSVPKCGVGYEVTVNVVSLSLHPYPPSVCVWVCAHMCAHVGTRGQSWMSFPGAIHLVFWARFWNSELTKYVRWPASSADLVVSDSSGLELQICATIPSCFMWLTEFKLRFLSLGKHFTNGSISSGLLVVSYKAKHTLTTCPRKPTPNPLPKKTESKVMKRLVLVD